MIMLLYHRSYTIGRITAYFFVADISDESLVSWLVVQSVHAWCDSSYNYGGKKHATNNLALAHIDHQIRRLVTNINNIFFVLIKWEWLYPLYVVWSYNHQNKMVTLKYSFQIKVNCCGRIICLVNYYSLCKRKFLSIFSV